jgi:hypothetical protein
MLRYDPSAFLVALDGGSSYPKGDRALVTAQLLTKPPLPETVRGKPSLSWGVGPRQFVQCSARVERIY